MSPEKQGAPGGAVQVPLSSLPGQWPRQKQVIAPVPPRLVTISTKETTTVHVLTLAMGPKSPGGQNAIFRSHITRCCLTDQHRLLSCCIRYMMLQATEACCSNCSAIGGRHLEALVSSSCCGVGLPRSLGRDWLLLQKLLSYLPAQHGAARNSWKCNKSEIR